MQPYSIKNCEFFKCGALYINMGKMSLVNIFNSYFCECVAPQQGGAVYSNAKNTTTKMCCFLSCATEIYVVFWWGTASNLECSVGSLTSQVTICKCNPNKDQYKGHIAYSTSGGKNEIEHANLTRCESDTYEGYHVVFSHDSIVHYSLGINNLDYNTLYSRDSTSFKVENCIFINNTDKLATISAASSTTITSCIFGYNYLDIGSNFCSLKQCTTSSISFGTNVPTDGECKTNVDPDVDLLQLKIKNVCMPGLIKEFECTNGKTMQRFLYCLAVSLYFNKLKMTSRSQ